MATTTDGIAIGAAARCSIIGDYDWDVTLRRFDDILCPVAPGRNRVRDWTMVCLPPTESRRS